MHEKEESTSHTKSNRARKRRKGKRHLIFYSYSNVESKNVPEVPGVPKTRPPTCQPVSGVVLYKYRKQILFLAFPTGDDDSVLLQQNKMTCVLRTTSPKTYLYTNPQSRRCLLQSLFLLGASCSFLLLYGSFIVGVDLLIYLSFE